MNEATLYDLVSLTIRQSNLSDPEYKNARPVKYLHRTKNFQFEIKNYKVDLRLIDMPVIGHLYGTDESKLDIALMGEVKVHCTCPDFGFGGFQYMGDQLDYGTQKETRPPDIKNPNRDGTVCKHVGHIVTNINSFKPKMIEMIKKSRSTKYKVVVESKLSTQEIIQEFTRGFRTRTLDKENKSTLHNLKFGDLLIMHNKDVDVPHRYDRLVVVKNPANKQYAIGFNKELDKFVKITNKSIKELMAGRKPEFDVTTATRLRGERKAELLEIDGL